MLDNHTETNPLEATVDAMTAGRASATQKRKNNKSKQKNSSFMNLRLACAALEHSSHSPEIHITEDQNAASLIFRIVSFMKNLKSSDKELFVIENAVNNKIFLNTLPLGKAFVSLCDRPLLPIMDAFPLHEVNPWVHVFSDQVTRAKIIDSQIHDESGYPANLQLYAERMNRVIAALRQAMTQSTFIKAEKRWRKRTSHAKSRFLNIVKAALCAHAKVMVVRLDLGLKRHEYLNPKEPLPAQVLATPSLSSSPIKPVGCPTPNQINALVQTGQERQRSLLTRLGFDEIDDAREKLLRRIRDVFGPALLGYIWKLEYGARKGFHYHCVFLFNGSVHRQDISTGNQIGKIWSKYAPHGLGIFRNCNANRKLYKFPAVGTIHYHQSGHWKGLTHIADYLSKPDYYIALKLPAGRRRRTFGTSVIPKQIKAKRGSCRSKPSGLPQDDLRSSWE